MDGGDCHTAVQSTLMPLNLTHENDEDGKFYVLFYVLSCSVYFTAIKFLNLLMRPFFSLVACRMVLKTVMEEELPKVFGTEMWSDSCITT